MSPQIDLSILIPSVPERFEQMQRLFRKLESQIAGRAAEILVAVDNRQRSIGLKRDMLVQGSRGRWVAFCDDDDDIANSYIDELFKAINSGQDPDVIVFDQYVKLNDEHPFLVHFGLEFENEQAGMVDDTDMRRNINRKPFHVCAWRGSIARSERVPDESTEEDWLWAQKLCAKAKTQYRINRVLHYYRFSDTTTAAAKAREMDEKPKEPE